MDEAGLWSFEPFNQDMIVKPLVGADYNRSYACRDLAKQTLRRSSTPLAVWTSPGRSSPCQKSGSRPRSKAADVGGSPSLDGVVADTCLLINDAG
jgi:hypothetical protein